MELKLEDLTKAELIRLFQKLNYRTPKQHDLLFVRWDSLQDRARQMSEEGSKASKSRDWGRAEQLFKQAESLWKQAEAVFVEAEKQCLRT